MRIELPLWPVTAIVGIELLTNARQLAVGARHAERRASGCWRYCMALDVVLLTGAALPHRRPAQPVQLPLPGADRARRGGAARALDLDAGRAVVRSASASLFVAIEPLHWCRRPTSTRCTCAAPAGHVGRARRRRRRSSSTSCCASRARSRSASRAGRGARSRGAPGAARLARDAGRRRRARAVDAARPSRSPRRSSSARSSARAADDAVDDARLIREQVGRCRDILEQMAPTPARARARASRELASASCSTRRRRAARERERVARRDRRRRRARAAARAAARGRPGAARARRQRAGASPPSARSSVRVARATAERCAIEVARPRRRHAAPRCWRASASRSSPPRQPGRGMGLGLFLARAVIERVGGGLAIDSRRARHARRAAACRCARTPRAARATDAAWIHDRAERAARCRCS